MKLKPHDCLVVLGTRGTGKSYWTHKNIVAPNKRVVVFDPHGEYSCSERVTLDELLDDSTRLDREAFNVSVIPSWRTPADASEQLAIFAEILATCENVTIVIEEGGLYRRHGAETVEFIACQSRHWGSIGSPLVLVAQRATQICMTAREQASKIVSFRQSSPADVDALVDKCGNGAMAVRSLRRRKFYMWGEEQALKDGETSPESEEENE